MKCSTGYRRLGGLLLAGCVSVSVFAQSAYSPDLDRPIPRQVFWGDLHVHSNWSTDSYSFGNQTLGPDAAYRFAKGQVVAANSGQRAQLSRPLDFLLVADHAEFLGVFANLRASGSSALKRSSLGRRWGRYVADGQQSKALREFVSFLQDPEYQQELTPQLRQDMWREAAQIADHHNQPGAFTAFVGYEWTSMVRGNNLHRIVLYADGADKAGQQPPFSSLDSTDPEDLWQALAAYEQATGGRVMAIPHNGNLSNGLMFADTTLQGETLSVDYAKRRRRWEPLYEVTQVKGDAEAHPLLSPNDPYADFETWDADNIARAQNKQPWMLAHEYARPALKLGLAWAQQLQVNPFEFGLIGSTDSHTALATADDNNFWGKFLDSEPTPARMTNQMGGLLWQNWKLAASGYTGIWARENTREALFEALQRREVYATTGPRITLRFFGGWSFERSDIYQNDIASVGYATGVPMGGQLPPFQETAPKFLLAALRDPLGANLFCLQIVKGWVDAKGQVHEAVYDVAMPAGQPACTKPKSGVVAQDNRYGSAQLQAWWEDPDFDASEHAFYYVRVLELPTPRWTAYDTDYFNVEPDSAIPLVTQERAYSSPIWYSPASSQTAEKPPFHRLAD